MWIHKSGNPEVEFLTEDKMIPLGRAERAFNQVLREIGRHNGALRKARRKELRRGTA